MTNKIVISVLTILLLSGCAVTNKYDAYSGKVIDAETKKPIEGAVVLAVYMTEQYGLAGAVSHFADAQEVITDKQGEFKIPSKRIITFQALSGWQRYPQFTIFKPGYGCYPRHRGVRPMFVPNGSLPSDQYVIVELPNVNSESREERLRNASCLPTPNVPDKKYIRLRELLDEEYKTVGY